MTVAAPEAESAGPALELASQGRRLAEYVLELVLFTFTLGIGWLIWLLVVGGRGQSPAKRLLGIHVVRADGSRAGLGLMLLREIVVKWASFAVLDLLLSLANAGVAGAITLVVFIAAALWCVWDANRQCLWDKALGTYVVQGAGAVPGAAVAPPSREATENLQTLQDLHNRGLLTDEEYEERRARELERL
ncbi:MAG: RDD family protein [Chloroflexi bacterium]|nr:RDD family protein [Chloroflexota bacterium]